MMGPLAIFERVFCSASHLHAYRLVGILKRNTKFDEHGMDRVRRVMRAFYHRFDNIFALNSEHRDWLVSNEIGFEPERVHLTAHWPKPVFKPMSHTKETWFPSKTHPGPVLYRLVQRESLLFIHSIW